MSPLQTRETPQAPSSRDKILDTCEALFARSGYAGVGLREVAEEVGLGKSSLFHHFASKQQIYYEVLLRVLERIEVNVAVALGGDAASLSATERLRRLGRGLVDALAEHPTSARLLLRALFEVEPFPHMDEPTAESRACDAVLESMIDAFGRLVLDGIASGEFREVSVPDTTTTMMGAAVFHFASGELGESLVGGSLYSARAVARRRRELESFFVHALVRPDRATD